ncbi:MAG TPA: type IV pilus secretin PilQ [Methylomirabilota bacterium]|nr:type IV pilus secretin PilQ [Methylomirabilota bacterium]
MNTNVRILVVAAVCALSGPLLPGLAAGALPTLHGLTAEAGPSGPVIHLRTDQPLETVHYSPQPGVWVVEMPETEWDRSVGTLTDPSLGVERAELERVDEFGKRVTRLTVWLAEASQLRLESSDDGLDLVFASLRSARPAPARPAGAPPAAVPAPVRSEPAIAGAAMSLVDLVPVASGDGAVIELKGDGAITATAFTLPDPDRLVVDLQGVVKRFDRSIYAVGSGPVRQVRVAQNRTEPVPVTRVVVDLDGDVDYTLDTTADGAVLRIAAAGRPLAQPLPVKVARTEPARAVELVAEAGPERFVPAETEVPSEPEYVVASNRADVEPAFGYEPEPEPAPAEAAVSSALFELPGADEAAAPEAWTEPQPAVADRAAEPEPVVERSPFVADPKQMIEHAPAATVLDAPTTRADTYATTEVETEEQVFTGEPISLSLKDADIRDVLKTFSALTQLNIIVDPGVGGSVTVELRDVPWDQALDLILRINNLDYVLENNVLRVATNQKLAAEKSSKIALEKQREQAKPLKTILKPLSYAKAGYVAGLLASDNYLLSDRGSVTTDERTNTLIIRDVVDRVEGVLRLIESLDQPTPQVVIEGRIVETTRDFSRELGVTWGFNGTMDTEHGNDTGLEFPNSIDVDGSVNLARGSNGILAFSFGDILNTFNLDFLLSASEAEGLTRIVSTPRVTTQNLQQASIRSGLQIPVQTIANNTVTVQYVDATLRLQVTPQITAEGTVNLDIDIKKQEPVLALAVQGGNNVPIFTRDATTQLLVRDGGTTVIAGIYQVNDQDNENRVPGLHKIPVLGNLFKNKGTLKRHDELLIFITPRIVKY